jgi:drug/metabolite transporter (DMT)-like permease
MQVFPETWVILSLVAAAFQTVRFMLQKVLSTRLLSPTGATFARFVYSAPVVVAGVAVYLLLNGQDLPDIGALFWAFAAVGGLAQVLATVCVVTLFKSRNFAVGITLMKTEVLLSVMVGYLLLGETVSPMAFAAILSGLLGVYMLSKPPDAGALGGRSLFNRSTALGLGAGLLFSVSAVSYRGASLEVAAPDALLRAAVTLAAVTSMQMVGMAIWLAVRDPQQLSNVWKARRVAVWIGLLSLAGSLCWFWAFALEAAAFVKAVGQVELILSLIASFLFFSERSSMRELGGIFVLGASIVCLVLVI